MWLKGRELANELGISPCSVNRLRLRRKVPYINLGTAESPKYRYQLPNPVETTGDGDIERAGMLSYKELATILGISCVNVRVCVSHGMYFPVQIGRRKYFTIKEVKRILALREKRSGQKRQDVSTVLVEWVRNYLAKDEMPVEQLSAMLADAGTLPEPQRSEVITKLWNLFDQVNELLKMLKSA